LLKTATTADGLYETESYADEAKAKALPSITLPDPFTDATKIGCFQLKNVESTPGDFDVYAQLIIDQSTSTIKAIINLYTDATCTTDATPTVAPIDVGTGATPAKCIDASADVAKGSSGSGSTPIKSFGVVSVTANDETTYSVYGFSDIASSGNCASTGTKNPTTSVINACMLVGNYVASNVAGPVYGAFGAIDKSSSGKKYAALFFSDKSC